VAKDDEKDISPELVALLRDINVRLAILGSPEGALIRAPSPYYRPAAANPSAAPADLSAPRKRRVVQGSQDARIEIKLKAVCPDGIPSKEKLANSELVAKVVEEFKKDPKIAGLGIPDRKSILRAAGRIPRKK
jgi:hypothetical protein